MSARFPEKFSCSLGNWIRVRTLSRFRNSLLTKHVVAAGKFVRDAGSTPAASTILRSEPPRFRAKDGVRRSAARRRTVLQFRVQSYGWQAIMFYTYLIESLSSSERRYVGHTADLKQRMAEHNAGKCPHTSKFLPWKLRAYVGFSDLESARKFEHYLKSGSGRAFANRHFWLSSPSL